MNRPSPAERAAAVRKAEEAGARRRNLYVVATVVAVLALVVAIGLVVQANRDRTDEAAGSVASAQTSPEGVTADHGIVVGDADAPHTIVVYEDFQCPVCQAFESETAAKLRTAVDAGTVRVEYRIVSFLDRASENAYSSRAANAALAVRHVGGAEAFAAFHDALFADQPAEGTAGPDNAELVDAAVEAGADRAKVKPLIEDGSFDDWVVTATDAMSKNGVTGTPSVTVDGTTAGDPAEAVQLVLDVVG